MKRIFAIMSLCESIFCFLGIEGLYRRGEELEKAQMKAEGYKHFF